MIYLDHAAATPVAKKVLEVMKPYFMEDFFNPSAAYLPAKKVSADYETAKAEIAHAIGAKNNDIVITAGATEANNLAFTCVAGKQNPHSVLYRPFSLRRSFQRWKRTYEQNLDSTGGLPKRILCRTIRQYRKSDSGYERSVLRRASKSRQGLA